MTNNQDDRPDATGERQPQQDSGDFGGKQRREPMFSGFDEDEEESYEEPDRDTDYASSYREDDLDEDAFDDTLLYEDEDAPPTARADERDSGDTGTWDEADLAGARESDSLSTDVLPDDDAEHASSWEEDSERPGRPLPGPDDDTFAPEEDEQDWADDEDYAEEDVVINEKWPLGLIAVAVVALLLVAAGGYGVIQQRSAAQDEIRRLQAVLATAASPTDVAASRDALQAAQARQAELQASVETLGLENRRLADTVAGLEVQLEAQQAAMAKQVATKPAPAEDKAPQPATPQPATPQPATPQPVTPKPAAPQPAAPQPATTAWFVNFGSYGQRDTAQTWAAKLQPAAGSVVITTGEKGGKTFYRVRVIELTSRDSAETVARQLESKYGLSKLWIGRQ